jgi:hypothetical protein
VELIHPLHRFPSLDPAIADAFDAMPKPFRVVPKSSREQVQQKSDSQGQLQPSWSFVQLAAHFRLKTVARPAPPISAERVATLVQFPNPCTGAANPFVLGGAHRCPIA